MILLMLLKWDMKGREKMVWRKEGEGGGGEEEGEGVEEG